MFSVGAVNLTRGLFQDNKCTGSNCRGGALFVNSTIALTASQFIDNASTGTGGGIYAGGAARLDGGIFENNQSMNAAGGGLYTADFLTLIATQFLTNTAYMQGGGAAAERAITLTGGLFQGNLSQNSNGGGIFSANTAILTGGLFQGNNSLTARGGGIFISRTLILTGTSFVSNTSYLGGAGAFAGMTATVKSSYFQYNRTIVSGYSDSGGAINVKNSLGLVDCQFLNNTGGGAYAGGDVLLDRGLVQANDMFGVFASGSLVITSTQFLSNTGVGAATPSYGNFVATVTDSLFQNNGGGGLMGAFLVLTGTNFISNSGGGASANFTAMIFGGQFVNNRGGGLQTGSTAILTSVQFLSNTNTYGGGGASIGNGTLIGGLFQGNVSTNEAGGGVASGYALSIFGTRFANNTAHKNGGGAFVGQGGTVTNAFFDHNQSDAAGGGIYVGGTLWMQDTQFQANAAGDRGGGAFLYGVSTLIETHFLTNTAVLSGGGVYAASPIALSNGLFQGNQGGFAGGGVYADQDITLTGGLLQGNQSGFAGGGLYSKASLSLNGTKFFDNFAPAGGGVRVESGSVVVNHNRIANAIFARNRADPSKGAAMSLNSLGYVALQFTTIASPTVAGGLAIDISSGTLGITDTIIANHAIGIDNTGGTVYEDYNLFYGNGLPTLGAIVIGGHDASGDPKFANPGSDDYHLLQNSAAIDTGTNVGIFTDLDGKARPAGAGFDIGAYEFYGFAIDLPMITR